MPENNKNENGLIVLPPGLNSCSKLYELAKRATALSYSPYSKFRVGAALLCRNGKVYLGANIENAAYSAGICAERSAFVRALTEGERDFAAIAVAGRSAGEADGDSTDLAALADIDRIDKAVAEWKHGGADDAEFVYCPPCGVCRQFMSEFCGPDFGIVLGRGDETVIYTLGELLPESFGATSMSEK